MLHYITIPYHMYITLLLAVSLVDERFFEVMEDGVDSEEGCSLVL